MRSRLALRTAALTAVVFASGLTAQAGSAAADDPVPLKTEAVFNNPTGTAAEQQAVVARQVELIAGAPAGARIRLAMFYADDPALPDALIAAHQRGVDVQAVFDEKAVSMAPYKSLLAELGGDTGKASWVMSCGAGRGCVGTRALGTVDAINHNKFLLLSRTGSTPNVVVQSSANLHVGRDGTKGWNNALVLTGNDGIYNAYNGYFDDLKARRANNDYYSTGRPPSPPATPRRTSIRAPRATGRPTTTRPRTPSPRCSTT